MRQTLKASGLVFVIFLMTTRLVLAQTVQKDSLDKARLNAPTSKDTAFGQKVKKIVPKTLYNFLFRDIYNTNNGTQVSEIEENPFKMYEGRWIRHIFINNLNAFGYSVYDTTRKPTNRLDRWGNKTHTITRKKTILKGFLFFEEGDLVNAERMKDNERYLRQQAIFHDARILIVPYEKAKDAVDVYVYTQDVWSLLPDISVGGIDNFSFGLDQRNFRGMAQSWKNTIAYNAKDPRQTTEFGSRYLVPSIGKSFISIQADLQLLRDIKLGSFRVFKPFLTPETKYAGAVEFNYTNTRTFEFIPDPQNPSKEIRSYFWNRSFLFDAWLGRSFKLFFGDEQLRKRARIIIAMRRTQQDFYKRERPVTDTSYQLYQDTKLTLFSLGYSNREYKRDVLIYGFGRTEDVPIGQLVSVVYGTDRAETGQRNYAGIKFSAARYLPYGYLYSLLNVGSYWEDGKSQQGVFNIENNYFTPLSRLGRSWYARNFVSVRYTKGINRFNNEYINISGLDGIQGISSDELRGTSKLVLGFESVLFSPINVLGFRIAPFFSADVGWTALGSRKLLSQTPFQGYGIGFRFRNESLTFDTFQIRFSYYAGIPDLTNPLKIGFDGITPLRFRDFAITTPEVVAFK